MPEGTENQQAPNGATGSVVPPAAQQQQPQQQSGSVVGPNGFPENTPWRDMAPEQQVAYWQYQSKKHESRAAQAADYDQVKAERDELKARTQTAEEKALEEAREEARRQGENIGAQRYLKDAISARLTSHLARSAPDLNDDQLAERVSGILDVVDLSKFVDANSGDLLNDKIKALTGSFVTQASGSQGQQNHQPLHAGGRTGGSPGGTLQSGKDAYAARKAQRTGSLTTS